MARRFTMLFAVLVVLVLPSAATFGQNPSGTSALKAQLERLHGEWFNAFDKGDGATMDRIEVPNLVLVDWDGKGSIFQKSGPRAGNVKPTGVQSRTLSDTQVRQFGDTAVLTGRLTSKGPSGTTNVATTTVVWVQQNNQWLVASVQWSGFR
jgi:ketosteroid isomerase-like protein